MSASEIKICFVGDVFPADMPNNLGNGIASKFFSSEKTTWSNHTKKIIGDADIAICNLESPLILDDQHKPEIEFAGPKKFSQFLSKAGFHIVSIANNHILEHGESGFVKTMEALTSQNIKIIGLSDQVNFSKIIYHEIKEKVIAFVSFSAVPDPKNQDKYAKYSEEAVLKNIRKVKSNKIDYLVIYLHWGDEYINIPSRRQVESARKFIDQGADIVVGHHPHVIQPFEYYHHGVIFYSLGNFIFDMMWSKNVRMGLVAYVTLDGGQVKVNTTPTFLDENYFPQPLAGKQLLKFNQWLSKKSNLLQKLSNSSSKYFDKYYSNAQQINRQFQRYKMKEYLVVNFKNLPSFTQKKVIYRFKNRLQQFWGSN
jgi:poly-gamma-glutamate synthesis protein (capsule biosynthesis protein)